jgi:hypothetical protein
MLRLMKTSVSIIAVCSVISCGKTSSPSLKNSRQPAQEPSAARLAIDSGRFEKLIAADDSTITQLALSGNLGGCSLKKISDAGCAATTIPLYVIVLSDGNTNYPDMGSGAQSIQYCLDQTGGDLKSAMREGYCFSNRVPYEKFSDSGLARKAYSGELGQCRLEKVSDYGCGISHLKSPLFAIRFGNKSGQVTNDSGEVSKYCFENAGADLRKLLNVGECSAK